MVRLFCLFTLAGCELYFVEPHGHPPSPNAEHVDAGVVLPDAQTCPAVGTHAEITYPPNNATNIAVPVPIRMHVFIPNTLDGKGIYLSDASGQAVDLSHWDASCSIGIPPIQTGPVQDQTWTDCYNGLQPDALYTWHIWITCYDPSGPHELATTTFRTAP